MRACLAFRIGRVDEVLARSGLIHLTEHLVLSRLGQQRYAYNGAVEPLRTIFAVAGEPSEVVGFLTHVTGALDSLPLDRLEEQRRILRTEAASRPFTSNDAMKALRFGAVGHGLVARDELGLSALNGADVDAAVRRGFTAKNAALWISGPLPDDLRFQLAEGERLEVPEQQTFVHRLPAYSPQRGLDGVVVSFTGPRTAAFAEAVRVLSLRLEGRLRFDLGLSYHIDAFYEPISGEEAHVVIAADGLAENSDAILREFLKTLDEAASTGATEEDLTSAREQMRKAWSDPEAVIYHLDGHVRDHLLGVPTRDARELLEEYERVTPQDTAARLTEALETAILVTPERAAEPPAPYSRWMSTEHEPVAGKKYRPQALGRHGRLRLIVGDTGISMIGAEREPITIYYESCAAIALFHDGSFEITGRDGSSISIDPKAWINGKRLAKHVAARIPPDRFLRIDQKETEELAAAAAGLHFRKEDLAPIAPRVAARIADIGLVAAIVWLFALVADRIGLPDVVAGVSAFVALPLYEGVFVARRGQTPGKMMFGVKVTQLRHDAPPSLGRSFGRGLCLLGYGITAGVPILALILLLRPLYDPYRFAVHDHIVKTVVLRS